jgi:DNA-binding XRE family transcriptional regulator
MVEQRARAGDHPPDRFVMDQSSEVTDGQLVLRRAHAVVKQQMRLAYAAPELVLLPEAERAASNGRTMTLQKARSAQKLSTQELANRSRISLSTIYRIEYGKTRPRSHVIYAISSALGLSPREIAEFRDLVSPDPLSR